MKCEYCQSNGQTGEKCSKCGAPLSKKDIVSGGAFFYRGYVVWLMMDLSRDVRICQFWLGERLVETIECPYPVFRNFVKEGEDCMDFYYKLLEVAQGKAEVMRIEELNNKYPASFEIRKIENEYLKSCRQTFEALV